MNSVCYIVVNAKEIFRIDYVQSNFASIIATKNKHWHDVIVRKWWVFLSILITVTTIDSKKIIDFHWVNWKAHSPITTHVLLSRQHFNFQQSDKFQQKPDVGLSFIFVLIRIFLFTDDAMEDCGFLKFNDETLKVSFLQSLNTMRKHRLFCDVVINVSHYCNESFVKSSKNLY